MSCKHLFNCAECAERVTIDKELREDSLGFGWYWADSEVLDEGWCGPFEEKSEAALKAPTPRRSEVGEGVWRGGHFILASTLEERITALEAENAAYQTALTDRAGDLEELRTQLAERDKTIEMQQQVLDVPTQLDRIRAAGWTVAVHNDYRQDGEFCTFWLFTRNGRCAKGEGPSDWAALSAAEAEMGPDI